MKQITNIKYNVIESANPKYVEVVVAYSYKNKLLHRYIFLTKQESLTNKDYLKQAKAQFEEDLKNHRVHSKVGSNKRGLVFATTILAACTVALGSFLVYQYLKPGEIEYKPGDPVEVKVDVPDLPTGYQIKLSNQEAKVNEDYTTKINLSMPTSNEDTHYRLPDALDKVTSYKTNLENTQYTYTLTNETEATLSIAAQYVFGPVAIEFKLVEVPGPIPPTPTTDYKILLSNESEGVALLGEQTIKGEKLSSFDVKFTINDGYKEPIKVRNITIGKNTLEYPMDYGVSIGKESYTITFNEPYNIDTDVVLTAQADKIVTGTRAIVMSSTNFAIYEDIECTTPYTNLDNVDASKDFVGYIKPDAMKRGQHLSLGVNVTYGMSKEPSLYGEGYKYHFVNEDVAEITIPKGNDSVTITPNLTTARAQFIYRAKAGSSDNLSIRFYGSDYGGIINWGDGSEPQTFFHPQYGYVVDLVHTYISNETQDRDYLIEIKSDGVSPLPEKFGFISGGASYLERTTPLRYNSGIRNIKSIRLTSAAVGENVLTSTDNDGFAFSGIDSIYIPGTFNISGKDLLYCNNLESFYAAPYGDLIRTTSEDHKLLVEINGSNESVIISVANTDEVDLTKPISYEEEGTKYAPITELSSYACIGRNQINKIAFSAYFSNIPDGAYPAIFDCPSLKTISIPQENKTFITDKGDSPVNAIIKSQEGKSGGLLYSVYTTIANTPMSYLNDCSDLIIHGHAFSSANSYNGDLLIDKPSIITIYPEAFFKSPITSITFGGNSKLNIDSYGVMGSYFYDCNKLTSIVINEIPADDDWFFIALIQKCPNLTKLDIVKEIKGVQDHGLYEVDNTIYQHYSDYSGMVVVAACSLTEVLDTVNVGGTPLPVVQFTDYVFNGNNVKEIYIPNTVEYVPGYALGDDMHAPFRVNDDHKYYKVDNSIEGQSTLYGPSFDPETEEPIGGNTLYAASLVEGNHKLVINDKINLVGEDCMGSNSDIYEIVFTSTDASQYVLFDGTFTGCDNLTTVDFTASKSGKTPTLPEEELGGPNVFAYDPYYKFVTIKVGDPITQKAFENVDYPLHVYNIELAK